MRYSDYDLVVLDALDNYLHEAHRVPEYLDLTRMRHGWLRYLILRIAVVSEETHTPVHIGNADRLLPELAYRVFDDDPTIWGGVVEPQISHCLDEAARLHEALTTSGAEPVRIQPGLGDPHRGGRTTTKVSSAEVVQYYKPGRYSRRDMLTAFFDAAELSASVHIPPDISVLDGYLQSAVPVPSPATMPGEEFWYRAGIFAAGTDCLGTVDLHYGNIAPAGNAIAIIDDETVLAPSPFDRERNVLTTLLLQDPASARTEVSAGFMATNTPGVSRNFPSLQASEPDSGLTVRMTTRLASKPTRIGSHVQNLSGYLEEFRAGLSHGYATIRRNRHALVDVLRSCPRESLSRAIVYSTPGYARLSAMVALSPSTASQREIFERLVEQLGRFSRTTVGPEIIASEARQLLGGDIPLFWIDPHTDHIVDGTGRVGRVRHPPIDECCHRLSTLDHNYSIAQARIVTQCGSGLHLAAPGSTGSAVAKEVSA
ncbi:DUF4135 domain-containing protein [Nocardia cyriacigeorgica]|uniref:DUF4135 domain-containing protein n=1 Tax=Nocardia cyriacigeorgica TaxID=135487 RepID=UPI0018940D09|nr:DUF4135 domain-containing protein [Nocardia cyriacigeorgica]MBF6456239.1 DUF4135 domain-containing protein [Nocardia cyriacigeorgica]MBF6551045.1 DUF4135 domain-containing protein [Nocardia cyriacigeorgica]